MQILITAGPTREYFDPVRFLTNASSGKMGAALAQAAIDRGFDVMVVAGPVACEFPQQANIISVTTTDEMLQACLHHFPQCVGVIGAAAPCDFRPKFFSEGKIKKHDAGTMTVELVETPDILAELGKIKRQDQWLVPFALETSEQARELAFEKLHRKNGDLIVLNGPQAMLGDQTQVEIINRQGQILTEMCGPKQEIASQLIAILCNYAN